tara:strand:+ start:1526 stop:2767 length:1242 start_codon:yes stop_codon:yes gene_type:complete
MAFPTLTPTSTQSAIVLPVTGTHADVLSSLPFGMYTDSSFISGAVDQVAYTYRKLGGDILDLEIKAENVYANYEEAVLEYSYLVNLHQAKNTLGSTLGNPTGSFDEDGQITSGQAGVELKYPKFNFGYAMKVGQQFSHEAGFGGTTPIYSASFDKEANKQDYDLQAIVSSSAEAGGVPYASIDRTKRIVIRDVFYTTPQSMWRFYGYYGGLNVVGNLNSYGQFADDSTWQVIPVWQNKLQAMQFEDHLYTRTSHYSYEIIDNKLRIYPIPSTYGPEKFWFRFSIRESSWTDEYNDGQDGVNNMNTLPFENLPYININSIGKQWIRRFCLALSKGTLGQVRSKFGNNVPIPGDTVTLNGADLLAQAKDEQEKLRTELKEQLDAMTYDKLIETDSGIVDNVNNIQKHVPAGIFVG